MSRAQLLAALLLPAAACALWTVAAGKDLNWDLLNYHYYAPFEMLTGRLRQDFFAASAQSYLNPVGYLPFYLMVSAGWHSVLASIALAIAHSANLALLYFLAWRLFAHRPPRERLEFAWLATALGAASAVFWATVGSSFIDPLLTVPLLGGLLLLTAAGPRATRRALLAGLLFGAAAALKYSNAIFGLAALPLAASMPGVRGALRLRAACAFGAGGLLGVALLAGPWLALLWREFGNPVFPLMNGWFQSPHAPAVNMVSERFTPRDLGAALALPFRMALLDRSLYSETFAPDLRLAALLAGLAALPLLARFRAGALRPADWRVLAFLGGSLVLWLATSANARYGLVILLLAGVCLARVVERGLPTGAARVLLLAMLAVQATMCMMAAPSRWFIAAPWSSAWLPFEVPAAARNTPALYLTVEALPMAAVAPFLHPASSFVNLRGQHSVPTDSARLAELLERHRGRVRVLGRGLVESDSSGFEDRLAPYNDTLLRIGYRVDAQDCFVIRWRPESDDLLSRLANRIAGELPPHEPLSLASCGLIPATREPADLAEERRVSAAFDRIEAGCAILRGQKAVTERLGRGWSRFYSGLDARLEAHGGQVYLNRRRALHPLPLGSLEDWSRADGPMPEICRMP